MTAACCVANAHLSADVITPVGVLATSEFGEVDVFGDGNFSDVFATDLIDGDGLIDLAETPENILDDLHDNDFSSTNGWHAGDFDAGLPGGVDGDDDPLTPPAVASQALEFDLGSVHEVSHAHIWQQNQGPLFGDPPSLARGVDQFRILATTAIGGDDFELIGTFNLELEFGDEAVPAQVIPFQVPFSASRIRFEIESAFSEEEFEFVGLSEVRFEGSAATPTAGDFDMDGDLDADDMDLLSVAVRTGDASIGFDVNGDGAVNDADRGFWVTDVRRTWFGDANMDGVFDTSDFVFAFTAGEYEDDTVGNSTWATGDWSGDGEFDSVDFVAAFTDGGFAQGPRASTKAVPEPNALMLTAWFLGMGLAFYVRLDRFQSAR